MSQAYADFGAVIATTDIDDAAVATLKRWLPTYLRQIETERELGYQLSRPRAGSYVNALEDTEFLDNVLPAVIVTTAQTDSEPSIAADGSYMASWQMRVSCVVRGNSAAQTRYVASLTEASIRRALVQHTSLGDKVHTLKWMRTQLAPLPQRAGKGRFLVAGMSEYRVWTQQTVKESMGPSAPGADPYADLPLVTSITTDEIADPIPQEGS